MNETRFLNEIKPYAVGIDVGGTKIAAGLVNRDGQILQRFSTGAHSEKEPGRVIEAIEQAYLALIADSNLPSSQIEAVGIGFPGNTHGEKGLVLVCSNLPAWDHVPLANIVAARIKMPVFLDNDCSLAALGEHRFGAGRGTQDMCYVTVSTGFGAGLIINNRMYTGVTGTAGELGHVVIEPGGPLCSCGKHGCLMAFASGIGMSRMAYEAVECGDQTILRDQLPADGKRISGELIAKAARQGDPVATQIVETAGTYCGIGLSMLVEILNPELIVLGGGLTNIGQALTEPMMKALKENTQPELWDSINIKPWQLGNDIGILGAAAKVFAEAEATRAGMESTAYRFIAERTEKLAPVTASIPKPQVLTAAVRIELEHVEGTIFDIQRYSLHDGPGLRTNVFFKGCPLRCAWCSNPESQQVEPEMALFAQNCMACGQFDESCPDLWAKSPSDRREGDLWAEYCRRAANCPTQAIREIGERRSAGQIMEEVRRDLPFYEDGGGLTLAGGEPTMQPHLAEALLRLAQAEGISTAMETCGHTHWRVFQNLLPYLDHILFDLKHVDSQVHRAFTGVDNELILSNLEKLAAVGARVTVRVPLIPGFNATPEGLQSISEFVLSLGNGIDSLDVLPYHTLGLAKYAALGRDYPWREYERLADEEVQDLIQRIEYYGLEVNVGG